MVNLALNMWSIRFHVLIKLCTARRSSHPHGLLSLPSQVQGDAGGAVRPAVSPGRRVALPSDLLDQEAALLLRAFHRGLHLPAQLHLAGAHPALLPDYLQCPDLRRPGWHHCQVYTVWWRAAGVSANELKKGFAWGGFPYPCFIHSNECYHCSDLLSNMFMVTLSCVIMGPQTS